MDIIGIIILTILAIVIALSVVFLICAIFDIDIFDIVTRMFSRKKRIKILIESSKDVSISNSTSDKNFSDSVGVRTSCDSTFTNLNTTIDNMNNIF